MWVKDEGNVKASLQIGSRSTSCEGTPAETRHAMESGFIGLDGRHKEQIAMLLYSFLPATKPVSQ